MQLCDKQSCTANLIAARSVLLAPKAKQVTCNECLDKAKRRRATSALDRITALEKENEELRQKLEIEFKEKELYIEKFKDFSERHKKLCLNLSGLTLHKK